MATKRKGMSKKVRFEVFKRDSFKCQYCGRSSPEVLLQVDHIHPVSKGGAADILNLITSCADCNAGKSDRELSDQSALAKQKAQLDELNAKREQLEMMLKWREGMSAISDVAIDAFDKRLSDLTGHHLNEYGRADVAKHMRAAPVGDVLDALDVAVRQYVKRDAAGKAIHETVSHALSKVSGIVRLRNTPEGERQLYYARGIMRKRFAYCPDWQSLKLLRAAVEAGADVEELKDLIKSCNSWDDFTYWLRKDWGVG